MVVIARAQAVRLELLGGLVEALGDSFPAIQSYYLPRASHHDEPASNNLIQLDSLVEILGGERAGIVMRGEAADAKIIQELSHILGVIRRPAKVRRVEFDDFIA